jgi:hypothetical protein
MVKGDAIDPGCVKTLRGMTAPGILGSTVTRKAKKAKICLPLGITTKSDFVFTRPRPQADMDRRMPHTGYAAKYIRLTVEVSFPRSDDQFSNVLPEGVAPLRRSQNRRCFLNRIVGNQEN